MLPPFILSNDCFISYLEFVNTAADGTLLTYNLTPYYEEDSIEPVTNTSEWTK